jgi:hypothetical protein
MTCICRDKSLLGLRKLVTDFEPTAMRIFKIMAQDMIIGNILPVTITAIATTTTRSHTHNH